MSYKYKWGEKQNENAINNIMRLRSIQLDREVTREEVIESLGTDKPVDIMRKQIQKENKEEIERGN